MPYGLGECCAAMPGEPHLEEPHMPYVSMYDLALERGFGEGFREGLLMYLAVHLEEKSRNCGRREVDARPLPGHQAGRYVQLRYEARRGNHPSAAPPVLEENPLPIPQFSPTPLTAPAPPAPRAAPVNPLPHARCGSTATSFAASPDA